MKHLLLIRHAKSSWDDFSQKDFDRPLNHRGDRDAPAMAKHLLGKKIKIDAFVSSPAKRAYTTCKYFAEVYGKKEKTIIKVPQLYEPSVKAFYEVIKKLDDEFENVAFFSHNPGVTAFANELTDTGIDNMPTCGVFAVKIDAKDWKDFERRKKNYGSLNIQK